MSEPATRGTAHPARMVEVGGKDVTARQASAECSIHMTPEACAALVAGTSKGDPLEAAKVAGLMAAKRTPELLPFCHPIALTGASVELEPDPIGGVIRIQSTVTADDRTRRPETSNYSHRVTELRHAPPEGQTGACGQMVRVRSMHSTTRS